MVYTRKNQVNLVETTTAENTGIDSEVTKNENQLVWIDGSVSDEEKSNRDSWNKNSYSDVMLSPVGNQHEIQLIDHFSVSNNVMSSIDHVDKTKELGSIFANNNNIEKENMFINLLPFDDEANTCRDLVDIQPNERRENKINKSSLKFEEAGISKTFQMSPLEKTNSLSHLDNFFLTSKNLFYKGQRAISFHEDTIKEQGAFVTFQNGRSGSHDDVSDVSISMIELEKRSAHSSPFKNLNKDLANEMYRKAVSLCELQNEKLRKNIEKIEKKFSSMDVLLTNEEDTDKWFPRLSYEDCSSCASCRSLSSSYHSLLYDLDTAATYQIYQPTVCDVMDTKEDQMSTIDLENETNKMENLKTKTGKFLRQGQSTIGHFKDRFKKKIK